MPRLDEIFVTGREKFLCDRQTLWRTEVRPFVGGHRYRAIFVINQFVAACTRMVFVVLSCLLFVVVFGLLLLVSGPLLKELIFC